MNTVVGNVPEPVHACEYRENIPDTGKITRQQLTEYRQKMSKYGSLRQHPAETVIEHAAFDIILKTLRPILAPHPVVMAGGCIRDLYLRNDPDLIRDYDVFVLGCDENDARTLALKLGERFQGSLYPTYPGIPLEPSVMGVWNMVYPLIPSRELIQIDGTKPTKPLQVIWSKAQTVEKLFETFDWNVCKFAYDLNTVWDQGKEDGYKGAITLNHVANPIRSLRRGFRLEEKMHMKMGVEQIETLASLILLEAGNNVR